VICLSFVIWGFLTNDCLRYGIEKRMASALKQKLENGLVTASVPCRIDMGGTLDLSTFYLPLRHYAPCTVNLALDMRTRIRVSPHTEGKVKISSRGFEGAEYPVRRAPMRHPLGLLFAVAAYFGQSGIHISVDSASPPRSGLGGSSAAAVALIGALSAVLGLRDMSRKKAAVLAHAIEGSVAGVVCGIQDHLAAAYGGVNLWMWQAERPNAFFRRRVLVRKRSHPNLAKQVLVAFCGEPHESAQVNRKWMEQFLAGKYRSQWREIIECTREFAEALAENDLSRGVDRMNRETDLRRQMTPEVLDAVGEKLVREAIRNQCGARFTGAGGGGCIWALGSAAHIERLKIGWQQVLAPVASARLLTSDIDAQGLMVETSEMEPR
jgi:D-glycero-alpha-D-manno-heptose-7-phosphate kinase